MKLLYVTTLGGTMKFFTSLITELITDGNEINIATNENNGVTAIPSVYRDMGCKLMPISCTRSPLSYTNILAISEIRDIVTKNNYDIVHCHTPIAAACTRLACIGARKHGTKVLYTAHGFHFYTGAPLKNWLLYYPIEKICSKWTDYIITINQEDYQRASRIFHSPEVLYVPGVGINTKKFSNANTDRGLLRKNLNIHDDDTLIISVGELNKNKNHSVIIQALAKCKNTKIHYSIAGRGELFDYLSNLARALNVEKQVHLLGYCNDVAKLYQAADICAFPSVREGQGIAAIEAMAAGLPLLVSDNRGLRGTLVDGENAIVCKYNDIDAFAKGIIKLANDEELRKKMGINNSKLSKQFDYSVINKQMKEIYSRAAK